ncbi:hypothetical protein BZA77DRAFT_356436 [Pyronema omphalodes]|nr:hypothetical protein BZA77DRAFT_356436 [Pyronema omphalodes]
MKFSAISLAIVAVMVSAVTAAPVAEPKNVFRPENIGMGYRGRKILGPEDALRETEVEQNNLQNDSGTA